MPQLLAMANVVPSEAKPSLNALDQAFKVPQFDIRIAYTKCPYYFPTSGLKNTTCLRWTIPHKKGAFVPDVSQIILAPEIKIMNAKKTGPPGVGTISAPCNNFVNSIFASLRISYNNV